jgi:hypothetical protein
MKQEEDFQTRLVSKFLTAVDLTVGDDSEVQVQNKAIQSKLPRKDVRKEFLKD